MLILPIKEKWFDMIRSGEKKEEYREIKPYYDIRLGKVFLGFPFTKEMVKNIESIKTYNEKQIKKEVKIIFRNGYSSTSKEIECICNLRIGQGKEEWGAEPKREYYILDILEVIC